jgi:DNA replication factor GINS
MYSELYKAWKSEKTSKTPQTLPDDFYKRSAGYLKSLEENSASADLHTLQGRLLIKEKEMATRLLEELRETRLRKIISAAKNGEKIDATDLTAEEKNLNRGINESLASFKEREEEKGEQTPVAESKAELTVVRFLQDIPEIIGIDLKVYGPYKKEDVGSLPAQNAKALIKQGAAKLVEVRQPQIAGSVSN